MEGWMWSYWKWTVRAELISHCDLSVQEERESLTCRWNISLCRCWSWAEIEGFVETCMWCWSDFCVLWRGQQDACAGHIVQMCKTWLFVQKKKKTFLSLSLSFFFLLLDWFFKWVNYVKNCDFLSYVIPFIPNLFQLLFDKMQQTSDDCKDRGPLLAGQMHKVL